MDTIERCEGCCINSGLAASPDYNNGKKFDFIVVGEAPGKQEEDEGRPFVGPSGRLLWEALRGAGVSAKSVYLTNLLLCRPYCNRIEAVPNSAITACTKRLKEELSRHSYPHTIIIPVGAYAWNAVAHIYGLKAHSISKVRGSIFSVEV